MMRILVLSSVFFPRTGGTETVAKVLTTAFVRLGHQPILVTETPGEGCDDWPFQVLRSPSTRALHRLMGSADVIMQHGLGARLCWPALLTRKPLVTVLHIEPLAANRRGMGLVRRAREEFRELTLRRTNAFVTVSQAMAERQPYRSTVVHNPYDDSVFHPQPNIRRERDLIFVGRLITEKGVYVLLEALAKLRDRGLLPSLTIVGSGPEDERLKAESAAKGLVAQVEFKPFQTPSALAVEYNKHRVIVIPSLCIEGLPLVATESLACGCLPIVSDSGGLPEAVGRHGVRVESGEVDKLASAIESTLRSPDLIGNLLRRVDEHLEGFRPLQVATRYTEILETVVGEADGRR